MIRRQPDVLPLFAVILFVLLMGALTGCGGKQSESVPGSSGGAESAPGTIVSVNGEGISQKDFTHRLEVAAGNAVLRQMVEEDLQLQFAKKLGVSPTDAEVEAKYAEASKNPDFAKNMAASHQTPEDVKRGIRVNLAQAAIISKGVTVTDADIQNFYKLNTNKKNPSARYYRPESSTLAVIVTDKEADATKALHDLASGLPFAGVAKTYSKDSSRANGGLLPPIQRGRVDPKKFPGLEQKIFALKPGQQIDRAKIAGVWWIIRCVKKAPETTLPFDKVKDECRTGALLTKGMAANGPTMQAQYAAFKKEAAIKASAPEYKDTFSTQ